MRHYDELATYERNGFDVIVDKTWEDIDPRGQFEDSDLDEMLRRSTMAPTNGSCCEFESCLKDTKWAVPI